MYNLTIHFHFPFFDIVLSNSPKPSKLCPLKSSTKLCPSSFYRAYNIDKIKYKVKKMFPISKKNMIHTL